MVAAALGLACTACVGSKSPTLGVCTDGCSEESTLEQSSDTVVSVEAGSASAGGSNTDSPAASQEVADAGSASAFEQRLDSVDEHMDYGYEDDAVLHDLSRAAGRAGTAQCLCVTDEGSTDFLVGCALDEGTLELWPLPIDFADAMECVIAQSGRPQFDLYAFCALERLESKVACYAERQGSGDCVSCTQDFTTCPHSDNIAATHAVCSSVGESSARTRRKLGE